jgi:transcription elongation factor Elf1
MPGAINSNMPEALQEINDYCPHCNELITLLVDITQNDYIEDCSVCCRPIRVLHQIEEQMSPLQVELFPET